MKSIYTLAAAALIIAGSANAQSVTGRDACEAKKPANAAIIARAQAAKTPAARQAILKQAIDADPANAVCLADMALQMSLATNVNPAAGPEEFGTTGDVPTTTDGSTPPAENPNQLNQGNGSGPASPAAPAL